MVYELPRIPGYESHRRSTRSSPRATVRALMCENTPAGTFMDTDSTFFNECES